MSKTSFLLIIFNIRVLFLFSGDRKLIWFLKIFWSIYIFRFYNQIKKKNLNTLHLDITYWKYLPFPGLGNPGPTRPSIELKDWIQSYQTFSTHEFYILYFKLWYFIGNFFMYYQHSSLSGRIGKEVKRNIDCFGVVFMTELFIQLWRKKEKIISWEANLCQRKNAFLFMIF